jgi:hypothetical protein
MKNKNLLAAVIALLLTIFIYDPICRVVGSLWGAGLLYQAEQSGLIMLLPYLVFSLHFTWIHWCASWIEKRMGIAPYVAVSEPSDPISLATTGDKILFSVVSAVMTVFISQTPLHVGGLTAPYLRAIEESGWMPWVLGFEIWFVFNLMWVVLSRSSKGTSAKELDQAKVG